MANVKEITEGKRGCGRRKEGGLYLRSDGAAIECDRLPIELSTCPCCGEGIKFSRTPQWIQGKLLQKACSKAPCDCPLSKIDPEQKYLLIWIGEKFYPTPQDFIAESRNMGLSRRIMSVPKGFEVGKTRVFLGHIKAVRVNEGQTDPETGRSLMECRKGVFSSFTPMRIEYVVTGKETEEELERMERRGITLVNILKP